MFIQEISFENVVWKMAVFCLGLNMLCVKTVLLSDSVKLWTTNEYLICRDYVNTLDTKRKLINGEIQPEAFKEMITPN